MPGSFDAMSTCDGCKGGHHELYLNIERIVGKVGGGSTVGTPGRI